MRDFRMEIVRNNIPIGKLKCKSITIKYDSTAEVMRGMQCEAYTVPDMTDPYEFDMFGDRLRPILIEGGQEISLGTFMIIAAPEQLAEVGSYWNIEAYDETMLLKQAAITARSYFAAGTDYLTAIETLLTAVGFGNIVADPNADTLQIAREFEIGTSYIQIVNTLLEEINFNPVHAGSDGYIYLTAKTNKSTADFVYKDRQQFSILGSISRDTDIYDKPNVLTGVISNPQQSPITYTVRNTDPNSVLSTVRRGYEVVKIYKLSNIASQEVLEAYIDAELLNSMQTTETVEFQTLLEAGHEYRSTVQLATDLIEGLYTEKEWQINISPNSARMQHTVERRVFV